MITDSESASTVGISENAESEFASASESLCLSPSARVLAESSYESSFSSSVATVDLSMASSGPVSPKTAVAPALIYADSELEVDLDCGSPTNPETDCAEDAPGAMKGLQSPAGTRNIYYLVTQFRRYSTLTNYCMYVPLTDLSRHIGDRPAQPLLSKFPTTKFGSKHRSFSPEWYKAFTWVEYSIAKDAIYCYPCRHLKVGAVSRVDPAFTTIGFRGWKKAKGKSGALKQHAESANHRANMQVWQQRLVAEREKVQFGVDYQLRDVEEEEIMLNRHYLKSVMTVILTLARQNIPLRGHHESETSENPGNFRAILDLLVNQDARLQQKKNSLPRNARYLSPNVQNTILDILGKMVKDKICSELKASGAFTLMADETRDVSKSEQLSLVVRYVFEGNVCERFLGFVALTDLSAAGIAQSITKSLGESSIDLSMCVSQSYDGANVMSGEHGGVQAKIKTMCPQATYCHCYAHRLNLALVDCCKTIPVAYEYFSLLNSLYVFVSSSAVHCVLECVQENMKEINSSYKPVHLKRLSDTRWTCRVDSVRAVHDGYKAIIETLRRVSEGNNKDRVVQSKGLLSQIQSLQFIACTVIFKKALLLTKGVSDVLQSKQLDLAAAVDLVETAIDTLLEWREASFDSSLWKNLWNDIEELARNNEVDLGDLSQSRRRNRVSHQPTRLDEYVIMETTGRQPVISEDVETYVRVSVYYEVLDSIIGEMKRRFSHETRPLIRACSACMPGSSFLNATTMQPLIVHYKLNFEDISVQAEECKRFLARKKDVNSLSDVLHHLLPVKEAFVELYKLLTIVLTMGVSTASCERSFSCLKRLKSYLRAGMGQDRLNSMALLAIERDLSGKIDIDEAIELFARIDKNRRIKLLK